MNASAKPRGPLWSREETMIAFNLYSKMPYGQIHYYHPDVAKLAEILGRPPASVSMKMCSFVVGDSQHAGLKGTSMSKMTKAVWDEFNSDPGRFMLESENLLRQRAEELADDLIAEPHLEPEIAELPQGETRRRFVNTRINQSLFRKVVLASYENRCCMTGIAVPELLIASHIVPWKDNPEQRINPRNGLCLNALHDRAFDRGLISVEANFKVCISPKLKETAKSSTANDKINFVLESEGRLITPPQRFAPAREFLEYHRCNIFQR